MDRMPLLDEVGQILSVKDAATRTELSEDYIRARLRDGALYGFPLSTSATRHAIPGC